MTLLCIGIPALLVALAPRLVQTPPHFRRSVAIAWLQGHAINNTVTHTIKCVAGSPRPNFYALAAIGKELTGRKSFPSGHTSMAATAMTMLALLLIRTVKLHPRYVHSSAAAFALRWTCIGLPALFAMWVGVTRTQDYYHSFVDVLAGACVGVMSGVAGHFIEGLDEQLTSGGALRKDSISGQYTASVVSRRPSLCSLVCCVAAVQVLRLLVYYTARGRVIILLVAVHTEGPLPDSSATRVLRRLATMK